MRVLIRIEGTSTEDIAMSFGIQLGPPTGAELAPVRSDRVIVKATMWNFELGVNVF